MAGMEKYWAMFWTLDTTHIFQKSSKYQLAFPGMIRLVFVFLVYKECGCFLQSTLNYPHLWRQQDKLSPNNQMNVKKPGPDKQVWLIEKSR